MPGVPDHEDQVVDLGALDLGGPAVEEGPARRVEQTRATLAYLLLALLAAVMGTDLGLLGAGIVSPSDFGSVAGVLVSPVVGLLGAATGYYYGKAGR